MLTNEKAMVIMELLWWKEVNICLLKSAKNVENYNRTVGRNNQLTEEQFKMLKEWADEGNEW